MSPWDLLLWRGQFWGEVCSLNVCLLSALTSIADMGSMSGNVGGSWGVESLWYTHSPSGLDSGNTERCKAFSHAPSPPHWARLGSLGLHPRVSLFFASICWELLVPGTGLGPWFYSSVFPSLLWSWGSWSFFFFFNYRFLDNPSISTDLNSRGGASE